ncbi:TonB-dependent receptor domain-containing protein [Erythrobacter donghaensis]|jgi:outer membrane receptor protein involved in Fe transport|uniref:TonB-dependent receptor domain-containing protein n=1 Tax=Erythrobacter donghaensis TaxID=267135 RepID=UPI00093F8881|nr:TonB-dependent receptor [Erythrobacter donghaensis]
MLTGTRLAGLLLLTTSLTLPSMLQAQEVTEDTVTEAEAAQDPLTEQVEGEPPVEEADISIPGGEIVVTGRRGRNPERSSGQVLNVLTEADIARTGDGDIAGALGRVSGLSLVGNGRVFVRGLGDRYSLALLNGLPLPSPEPLSRVVPLDIFPTSVISSSLVQKTYSANFPLEFGGGVINLTTKAVPTEDFLTLSISGSGDTETTFENGLTYFGSDWDVFGFDNGNRDIPSNLQAFFDRGERIDQVSPDVSGPIAAQLFPTNLVTLQRIPNLRPNFSANITGGFSVELGDETYLGVIATGGISNKYRNRSVLSQVGNGDLSQLNETSTTFITDNNVLVNALIGVGLDIGEHTVRWTNLYIRDTLKTARLGERTDFLLGVDGIDYLEQQTAWFERQLIDTQLVTELNFGKLGIDLRGGFARTDREAPYNATFEYVRTNNPGDPFGDRYLVNIGGIAVSAARPLVEFDDLQEDQYFGGIDVSYELLDTLDLTVGYSYLDTSRRSSSRAFQPLVSCSTVCSAFLNGEQANALINAIGLRQPGDIINGATTATTSAPVTLPDGTVVPAGSRFFDVTLFERSPFPVFDAALTVHAGYGQVRWAATDRLTVEAGVRYEDGVQTVAIDQTIFNTPIAGATPTNITNDYLLPGGTITYEATDDLQLRVSASQTIARPQFRELVEQLYFDPESNRRYIGNPFLQDSELTNFEARAEYYFGGRSRVSLAGFYKDISNPIENFLIFVPGELRTSFANAPSAELYGAEVDASYAFDLYDWGGFFATKQLLVLANYTYSTSSISVSPGDLAPVPGTPSQDASLLFDAGASLVGQSDHVANLSIGLEDTEKVQQFTFLFNYASERVTLRGGPLPDVVEDPGLTVDFVARGELKLGGVPLELSFDVRNIFGRDNFEFQEFNGNRIEINTFEVGTSFNFGLKASF